MDSDQYRAWLLGIAWTLAPSPVVDQSTPSWGSDLDLWHCRALHGGDGSVVTGVGMIRLLQPPIELDDRSQADQARPVNGPADAYVE